MIELHARAAILASAVILAACGSGGAPGGHDFTA